MLSLPLTTQWFVCSSESTLIERDTDLHIKLQLPQGRFKKTTPKIETLIRQWIHSWCVVTWHQYISPSPSNNIRIVGCPYQNNSLKPHKTVMWQQCSPWYYTTCNTNHMILFVNAGFQKGDGEKTATHSTNSCTETAQVSLITSFLLPYACLDLSYTLRHQAPWKLQIGLLDC